jgi:D-sedoheptulose 7-phosphate isomerase
MNGNATTASTEDVIQENIAASIAILCLRVPSRETPRIQEAHILIGHTISEIVEEEVFQR